MFASYAGLGKRPLESAVMYMQPGFDGADTYRMQAEAEFRFR